MCLSEALQTTAIRAATLTLFSKLLFDHDFIVFFSLEVVLYKSTFTITMQAAHFGSARRVQYESPAILQ